VTERSKRGRETALDMLRSMAVVVLLVIPLWFFGQASKSDTKSIRPVDPTAALQGFAQDTKAPVPSRIPEGWVVNVARGEPGSVRVGYVLDEDFYLEFAGGQGATFLEQAAGKARGTGAVDVQGVSWQRYESEGHESLVRVVNGVTLVVGGVRENVTTAQLQQLAALVR
jgi:hypothetical protein